MLKAPKIMIFDLDGTLTLPLLDFDLIRKEIGIPSGTILEALEEMSAPEKARAFAIVEQHERHASENAELQDGVHKVFDYLRGYGIPIAILTRNSAQSARTVMDRHGLAIDYLYTREDGPVKPAPDSVCTICGHFGIEPSDAWIVGDYLYDIECGKRVSATTVLMVGSNPLPDYADQADYVVRELKELISLLEDGQRHACRSHV